MTEPTDRLSAACRLALAAYLHDLGKLAERARIPEAMETDANGLRKRDRNVQLYCPQFNGRHTHIHAAYTAIGFDLLEPLLPPLVGVDMRPFAPWREWDTDDSLINAAARHHLPDTALQWVVATADRLASGFERQEFEDYNQSVDAAEGAPLNHYTTRLWTLLEPIRLSPRLETRNFRYPLQPLAPMALFPVPAEEAEHRNHARAKEEYLELWKGLRAGLERIPEAHRANLPLWFDHFDSLWQVYTHAIPAATAGIGGNVRPDVSLYDHSRTTAALATALWRYHADHGHDPEAVSEELRAQWDRGLSDGRASRDAWNREKFLLIQGDLFGIQDFIFATGGATQKRAAKLLRGRSFYVALLTELAALRLLEALELPATSQVVNAAGKFLIVAPNTPAAREVLEQVRRELDEWFLRHTHGQAGIGLASLGARATDFRAGPKGQPRPFAALMRRLFENLETAKSRRFGLCGETPPPPVFGGYLDAFQHGECQIDGRSPAEIQQEGLWVSAMAADQIDIGRHLAADARLLITRRAISRATLRLPVFGYHITFDDSEDDSPAWQRLIDAGELRRAWDFSPARSGDEALWHGCARRAINAYVPRFTETDLAQAAHGLFDGLDADDRANEAVGEIKTLNHLARGDRRPHPQHHERWIGAEALLTLKGDVDNLGRIFQEGIRDPTFARMAALSRQINAFFAVYLPWLCATEFPDTYTVFAGGDDFFLIGPWHSTIKLAQRMKTEFARYVARNPDIHFSAGLSMTKPGLPIRQLADLAEDALDEAKAHNPKHASPAPKDAVTAFGESVTWKDFDGLMTLERKLADIAGDQGLSTGYLYGLLRYIDMAEQEKAYREAIARGETPNIAIGNALWHSHFAYQTRRLAETRFRQMEDSKQREALRRALQALLAEEIASHGIERHGAAYKIALFTYLYLQRD